MLITLGTVIPHEEVSLKWFVRKLVLLRVSTRLPKLKSLSMSTLDSVAVDGMFDFFFFFLSSTHNVVNGRTHYIIALQRKLVIPNTDNVQRCFHKIFTQLGLTVISYDDIMT